MTRGEAAIGSRARCALAVVVMLLSAACGADDTDGAPQAGSSGTSAGGSGGSGQASTAAATGATTSGGVADSGSTSGGRQGSSGGSSGPADPPAPDGESCEVARGCRSGACFDAGILGGICGECASSSDCERGCRPPHPFLQPVSPSACERAGQMAAACETQGDCDGPLVCTTVFALPGVFDIRGCGSCQSVKDCARGEFCSPTYDLLNLAGTRECAASGSLPDGAHCDPNDGAAACVNTCRAVDYEGLATLGVCSSCGGDGDCEPKTEMCAPPAIVDGALVPAACVPVEARPR